MSSGEETMSRTVLLKSDEKTLSWERVKDAMIQLLCDHEFEDEVKAVVPRRDGWEVTFGDEKTADYFLNNEVEIKGDCYLFVSSKLNYSIVRMSEVPVYIPDECIAKELAKFSCSPKGESERVEVDGIETGERKMIVLLSSDANNTLPEVIHVAFGGKEEPIRIEVNTPEQDE